MNEGKLEYTPMPKAQQIKDTDLISTVEANTSRNTIIYGPEFFDPTNTVIEPPLIDAVKQLYELNIPTNLSGANNSDIGRGFAWIQIDYDKLSKNNKQVAQKLIEEQSAFFGKLEGGGWFISDKERDALYLKVPLNRNSTVGEIKIAFLELAKKFQEQCPEGMDVKTALKICGDPHSRPIPISHFTQNGLYYNPDNRLFYTDLDKLEQSKRWIKQ